MTARYTKPYKMQKHRRAVFEFEKEKQINVQRMRIRGRKKGERASIPINCCASVGRGSITVCHSSCQGNHFLDTTFPFIHPHPHSADLVVS